MFITLAERIVVRVDDPTSTRRHHIAHQARKIVDSYVSGTIPRVGETIYLADKRAYDVQAVIHYKRPAVEVCDGNLHQVSRSEVLLEVTPHENFHCYDTGSYSFRESWPLIMDLEDMPEESEDK